MVRDVPADEERAHFAKATCTSSSCRRDPPTYRFDPARDESRVARLVVDDALKRAAGRTDPWTAREEPVDVAGSRYVDWLIPGIIGMNIMSTGMWGIGFSIVQARMRKLLKRLVASPMRKQRVPAGAGAGPAACFSRPRWRVPLVFGALAFGMPIHGSIAGDLRSCALRRRAGVRRASACCSASRARDVRSDFRADEPDDACRCGC